MQLQDVRVLAEGLAFPEGPIAMQDGSVIVCEVRAGRLSRVGSDGRISALATVGGGPNGAAVGPDGAIYVCNNGFSPDGGSKPAIQWVDPETGKTDVLYADCDGQKLVRPNDLVFDSTEVSGSQTAAATRSITPGLTEVSSAAPTLGQHHPMASGCHRAKTSSTGPKRSRGRFTAAG